MSALSPRFTLPVALVALLMVIAVPTAMAATPGPALVVGSADNGVEGNNLKASLEALSLPRVDRASDVPEDLSGYQSVWYIEAYAGLDASERDRLVGFSRSGGNLYLTGERPCCETLNAGVQDVLRRTLKDTDVQVGGLGDIDGPFAFNSGVTDYVATFPNFLVDFIPHSPGGMAGIGGVNSSNVLARSTTVPVGAVWAEKDMVAGKGRTALLMDIDWLKDVARGPIVENLANFLSTGSLCTGDGAAGLRWDAGPGNCTALNTPLTATWKVTASSGPAPALTATASGVTSDCTNSSSGSTTTLTCKLTDASSTGASLRVTATGATGSTTRHYRVRAKNDVRNVPPGRAADSNWWDWPDADEDGLPDYWEEHGVWVKNTLLDLPGRGARKDHKDLFLYYEFQSGQEQTDTTLNTMIAMFSAAPLTNPDGANGVRLHIKRGESIPSSVVGDFGLTTEDVIRVGTYSGFLNSPEYGGTGVPPIYKWMLNFDAGDSAKHRLCGMPASKSDGCGGVKGEFAWTATGMSGVDAALGINLPVWSASDRENARQFVEASNAAHELGHLLGLHHHGKDKEPVDDKSYKSIMSYAYSHFGLPGDGFLPLHHLDYSRLSSPNLDWHTGKDVGSLTFVAGQDGEIKDFYANGADDELVDNGQPPGELSTEDALRAATPDSARAFISAFNVPAAPAFPTLSGAETTVVEGESVDIDLHGADPAGGVITYAVSSPPQLGSAVATATGIRYTAGAVGDDTLIVRAFNAKLGSEPATVTIHVTPSPVVVAPQPQAPTTSTSPPVVKRPALRLTKATVKLKGRRITFRLRLSEAAKVELVAERRTGKRYKRAARIAPKAALRAGTRSVSVAISRTGTYRLTLTARTPDGRKATLHRTLRVKRLSRT